jgi:hypothetical protein
MTQYPDFFQQNQGVSVLEEIKNFKRKTLENSAFSRVFPYLRPF